jgi:hypothetical protein
LMLCALEFIGRGMEAEFGVFWVEGWGVEGEGYWK